MEYVLPLKARPGDDLTELASYVANLSARVSVIVVDGSDPVIYARNADLFAGATHVPPRPDLDCLNGKVSGVLTGFALCRSDKVVVADDDVRYEPAELDRLERLLDEADIVSPQNYYAPLTGPALWDTARILINRTLPSGDFPGTLGLRLTERMRRVGYDGDVLFENLELIRSVVADGGRALVARDLYVRRLPPDGGHFLGQRVRQAYDSQAQPLRLLVEMSLVPLLVSARRRPGAAVALAGAAVGLAEAGRRRSGGAGCFPIAASLLAPMWAGERAVCAWIALGRRMARGGTPYSGRRIRLAAHPVRTLRRERASADDSRRRTVSPTTGRIGTAQQHRRS